MIDALPRIPCRWTGDGFTPATPRAKPLPDPDYLRECFRYEGGALFWLPRPRGHFASARAHSASLARSAGRRAGSPMANGYRLVALDGKKYLEHRLMYHMLVALLLPAQSVDHIDRDHTNNKIENLRACTHAQNLMNQPGRRSKYGTPKGVHWSAREKRFKVALRASGRIHNIGTFETIESASAAAEAARVELHGEFANHRSAR